MVALYGHRGARGLYPENTIAGFRAALALGVDGLELDVALTADQVPVVTHDPALKPEITRGPDGAWLDRPGPLVSTVTAEELAAFDVGRIRPGTAYAAAFPDQTPVDGARIPTLAAVLGIEPAVTLLIELKTSPLQPDRTAPPERMATAVATVLAEAGALDRAIILSFDWRALRYLRRACPGLTLSWLTAARIGPETRAWWGGADPALHGGSAARAVAAEGGPIWSPAWQAVSEAALAEARALGLAVIPWTVNRPEPMRRLIRLGVDGLITDRPDIARAVLAAEGIPPPPARDRP